MIQKINQFKIRNVASMNGVSRSETNDAATRQQNPKGISVDMNRDEHEFVVACNGSTKIVKPERTAPAAYKQTISDMANATERSAARQYAG